MIADFFDSVCSQWKQKTGETGAKTGLIVWDCVTGDTSEWHADEWFIPASNNKLWTTAVALEHLGSEYYWETNIGVYHETLWIKGGGDPLLGWEQVCRLAAELKEKGVASLREMVLDDSLFLSEAWGRGWMWDDLSHGYAAPVHACNLELNRIPFAVEETELRLSLKNPFPFVEASATANVQPCLFGESDYAIRRLGDSYHYEVKGRLSRDEENIDAAVASGPRFLGQAFSFACKEAGIHLHPEFRMRMEPVPHEWITGSTVRLLHPSPPLGTVIRAVNQESCNLAAEVLLRTIGLHASGTGSAEKGIQCVIDTLQKWEVPQPGNYADGSGLSMYNLSSPKGVLSLLKFYLNHPEFPAFFNSLARYGISGTLKRRKGLPAGWDLRAKTGTLYGVKTLSGYLLFEKEIRFIFSLMINGLLKDQHGEQLQDELLHFLVHAHT